MPLSRRWTLTRYLIEERRRFPQASGELNALILDVSLACKAIARIVAFGELGDSLGQRPPPAGRRRQRAGRGAEAARRPEQRDLHPDERVERPPRRHGLRGDGRATADPGRVSARQYLLVFDPLDGSSNIDVNVSVGSIFSILRAPQDVIDSGRDVTEADFLQPGATQVAAGYAIYGPTTMLVLTVGNGVAGFTLNPNLGEFVLTHPNIQVPPDTQRVRDQHVEQPLLGAAGQALRRRVPGRQDRAARQGLQHALDRLDGRRGAPHPDARRRVHVPARHEGPGQAGPAAPAVRSQSGRVARRAGGRARQHRPPARAGRQAVLAAPAHRPRVRLAQRGRAHRALPPEPSTRDEGVPLFAERSLFRD